MAIMLCEVPLNKGTHHTERVEKERQQQQAVELLVHSTHTKSIFAEVAPVAFWVVSASPKFNTTRCSCSHHQLVEVMVLPRRGTVGVGHANRTFVYGVAVQSVYVLLL